VDEDDVTAFTNRLSITKLKTGNFMGGSRTFAGIMIFLRMVFKEYQKKNRRWFNPFQDPRQQEPANKVVEFKTS
jgi:hypothetical protein